jgi:hypothetical protein
MRILESALTTTVFLTGILIANRVSTPGNEVQTSTAASYNIDAESAR